MENRMKNFKKNDDFMENFKHDNGWVYLEDKLFDINSEFDFSIKYEKVLKDIVA
jgi:hypothetical protein